MASQPDPGGARHVGRVIDPLARDDGETEPELQLDADVSVPVGDVAEPEGDAAAGLAEEGAPSEGESAEPAELESPLAPRSVEHTSADVHPVKARLLAKARAARAMGGAASATTNVDEFDASAEPSTRPPSAPFVPRARAQLSPTLVAVFGTLLGLATVASIIALAMSAAPQPWLSQASAASVPAPVGSAPADTTEAAAPKPQRVKVPGPWRIADAKGEAGLRVIEGTIGLSPFLRAIQDAGLEKKEAYRVLTALKDQKNLDKCARTDRFAALVERSSKRVKAFEYIVSLEEVYQAREGSDGLLTGKRLDLKVARNQVQIAFAIDGGFEASAQKAGLEKGLASVVEKALDGHMSLEELERGDTLRVIAQEVTVLGEFARYAGVEAVEVRRAKSKDKPLRVYYFKGPGAKGYYDAAGRAPYEGGWRKPVKDAPITSKFNPKRLHPVLKKVMPHTGTDFGAPSGTPVGASSYGTVSFVGNAGPSGNLVKIEHPGGIETGYAHLSRFADGVKVGDKVTRLQVIGYVGSTGRSTGPHLHFTAKKNGEFFDPETLNLDGMRVLPSEDRNAFAKIRAAYDALLDAIPLPAAIAEAPAEPAPEPTQETAPEPDLGEPEASPAVAPAATAAATSAPAPAPATPATPANTNAGNPIYLTDKDLLQMQSSSDDGEVSE